MGQPILYSLTHRHISLSLKKYPNFTSFSKPLLHRVSRQRRLRPPSSPPLRRIAISGVAGALSSFPCNQFSFPLLVPKQIPKLKSRDAASSSSSSRLSAAKLARRRLPELSPQLVAASGESASAVPSFKFPLSVELSPDKLSSPDEITDWGKGVAFLPSSSPVCLWPKRLTSSPAARRAYPPPSLAVRHCLLREAASTLTGDSCRFSAASSVIARLQLPRRHLPIVWRFYTPKLSPPLLPHYLCVLNWSKHVVWIDFNRGIISLEMGLRLWYHSGCNLLLRLLRWLEEILDQRCQFLGSSKFMPCKNWYYFYDPKFLSNMISYYDAKYGVVRFLPQFGESSFCPLAAVRFSLRPSHSTPEKLGGRKSVRRGWGDGCIYRPIPWLLVEDFGEWSFYFGAVS